MCLKSADLVFDEERLRDTIERRRRARERGIETANPTELVEEITDE